METMLDQRQSDIVKEITDWVKEVCEIKGDILRRMRHKIPQYTPGDVFIGYHEDIIPSTLLSQAAKVRSLFMCRLVVGR